MSDNAIPGPFPSVSPAQWRERAEAGSPLRERPLLEGPTVQVLHTERPTEERGRPGASPFVRGATPRASVKFGFEAREAADLPSRVAAAVAAGAQSVRLGPGACAGLDRAGLAALIEACGTTELTLVAGSDAIAWAVVAPDTVRVADDPLAALARTGQLPCAAPEALRRSCERAKEASGRPLEIDTRPYHDAGASPATEIALAASSGLALLRGLVDVGHPLADGPRRMSFTFALDSDVFMGIATLRAARWVWSKVLRALGIDGPEQGMRIHASSSIRAASRLEPMNNALRGTASAFAAYAGGANEITVLPFDEVTGAPSPAADRLALTTLHMLRWESHLGSVADPAGGSYHVESLTSALARQAWAELQEIEHHGGVLRGLLDGSLLERVGETAAQRTASAVTRRRAIVGASRYPSPEPCAPIASAERPASTASEAAKAPAEPRTYAEIFEMRAGSVDSLRAALEGPNAPAVTPFVVARLAEPFEALRDRAGPTPPEGLLLAVGAPAETRARVDFARDALGVAGMRCEVAAAVDLEAATDILAKQKTAAFVCLAAPDAALPELVPGLLAALDVPLVVAGPPEEALEGVLAFVHRNMNAVDTLGQLLAALATNEGASS